MQAAQPGKVLTTPWVLLGRLGLVVYGTTLVTQKIDEPMGNMINMVVFISVTSQTSLFELVVGGVTKQFCQDRLGVFFHSKILKQYQIWKTGLQWVSPQDFREANHDYEINVPDPPSPLWSKTRPSLEFWILFLGRTSGFYAIPGASMNHVWQPSIFQLERWALQLIFNL